MPRRPQAYREPFDEQSIWKMPIHVDAVYVDAQIPVTDPVDFDKMSPDENILVFSPDAPAVDIHDTDVTFGSGVSGQDRCDAWEAGTLHVSAPIAPSFATVGNPLRSKVGGNNATAILSADGDDFVQVNPFEACGGNPAQYVSGNFNAGNTVAVDGDGILGGHGGSGLSSIGGTLRLHELEDDVPIEHVLSINPWAVTALYWDAATDGFRWPAIRSDAYADDVASGRHYQGTVPECRMGALVALLPSFDETTMRTNLGRRLARCLKDYGAYIVDDSNRNVISINMSWEQRFDGEDQTAIERFQEIYGHGIDADSSTTPGTAAHDWFLDCQELFGALHVVDSNDAANIGGGPTNDPETKRRAPFAQPVRKCTKHVIGQLGMASGGDGCSMVHQIRSFKSRGFPDRDLQACTDRLLGYLWSDGTDQGGGQFFFRALDVRIADEFERCANMVLGAANVNRGFNNTNNFHTFTIQYQGLTDWPDSLPGYILDIPSFAASVIEGEGQGDDTQPDAGKIYDGPNANRRQGFADLVAKEGVVSTVGAFNVIADQASWPIFQTWPFVAFGRVPGA